MKYQTDVSQTEKLVISPGQALLLLIEAYKTDSAKSALLKKMYFLGIQESDEGSEMAKYFTPLHETPCTQEQMDAFLRDPLLANFTISRTPNTIDNDPTRRYFETHLAYNTLLDHEDKLASEVLDKHYQELIGRLNPYRIAKLSYVLEGNLREEDENPNKEYAHYIAMMNNGTLVPGVKNREKIRQLIQSSYLSVKVCNINNDTFPLNIYGTGIFHLSTRGGTKKNLYDDSYSNNLGTMRSTMPTPTSDITRATAETPFTRGADNSVYDENALWVKSNFDKLVHPFSNAISGTILAIIRCCAALKTPVTDSSETMRDYLRLLVTTMLIASGGHSFYEYCAVFELIDTRKEFERLEGFENLTMEALFLTNNEAAFDKALASAIEYNKLILQRQNVHRAIEKYRIEPERSLFESISDYKNIIKHIDRIQAISQYLKDIMMKTEKLKMSCSIALGKLEKNEQVLAIPGCLHLINTIENAITNEDFTTAITASKRLQNKIKPDSDDYQRIKEVIVFLELLEPSQSALAAMRVHFQNYIENWNKFSVQMRHFKTTVDDALRDKIILDCEYIQVIDNELTQLETLFATLQPALDAISTRLANQPLDVQVDVQQEGLDSTRSILNNMRKNINAIKKDTENNNKNTKPGFC